MPDSASLLGKISRAFWLQIGLITLAAILGVYLAKVLIEENLVQNAILEVVLTILYLTLWSAYRFSRRTISPFAQLTDHINKIDLNKDDFSLNLTELEIPHDGEVRTLIDAISRLGERLDSYITRERNFRGNASHELRTPLAVINVATDMT